MIDQAPPAIQAAAAPACAAVGEMLAELFPKSSRPYALEKTAPSIPPIVLKEYGGQLYRSFSLEAYRRDGTGGWAAVGKSRTPIPEGVDPPHRQTIIAFMRSKRLSASASCPNLAFSTLSMGWIRPSEGRPEKDRDGLYPYTSVSISLPIIGNRGREAIMWVDESSGPLAGSSRLVMFRLQQNGRWRPVGWFPVAVS